MSVAVYRVRLAIREDVIPEETLVLEALREGLQRLGRTPLDIGVALEGSSHETSLAAELERDQAEQDAQEQDPREEL